jgi:hypothetical protein
VGECENIPLRVGLSVTRVNEWNHPCAVHKNKISRHDVILVIRDVPARRWPAVAKQSSETMRFSLKWNQPLAFAGQDSLELNQSLTSSMKKIHWTP